jgi:ParB family chromosome partitioning protein
MTKSTEEKKAAPLPRVQAIKVSEIAPSPLNERGDVVETVDDLVASIKEKGILVPIKVRPVKSGFQVVYGHRRLLAAKKAGLVHVPAIVEEMDDEQADRERLTENLQRLDLHPIDEAKGIARLVKLLGFVDRVAKHLGKDEAYVAERANLVNLDKAGQDWFRSGVITAEHARILARLTPDDQKQALAWLIEYENPEESDYS